MNIDVKPIYRAGIIAVIIPVAAFLGSWLTDSMLMLDYIHVLLGAIWTGVDVFYGLIFYFVISSMGPEGRSNISIRLIPMSLFFIPATSILTPLAGYILAVKEGIFSIHSDVFIAAIILGTILVLVGFLTIVLSSAIILKDILSGSIDQEKNSKLLMFGSRGALVQLIFQIAIISVMAYIVVFIT